MKNSSNFFKKTLQVFIVLLVGFIGGVAGTWGFSYFSTPHSAANNNQKTATTITTSYKNSNSTTEAVDKVKDALSLHILNLIQMLFLTTIIQEMKMIR